MADSASDPLRMPSGEIVFDQIVQRTSRLFDERTAQNTRASFVLGSASVFLGVVAGGFSALVNTLHAYRGPFIWGLVVEAVLFLAGIYYAGTAYADDDVIDIDPSSLTAYYERPEEVTQAYIADALLRAYARDRAVLMSQETAPHGCRAMLPCANRVAGSTVSGNGHSTLSAATRRERRWYRTGSIGRRGTATRRSRQSYGQRPIASAI